MIYQWGFGFKNCAVAGVLLGFGMFTAPTLAAISSPTGSIMGRAPTLTPGEISWDDKNSSGVIDIGDELSIDQNNLFVFVDEDEDTPTENTYQWLRDGSPIVGATSDIYSLGKEDLGAKISLEVTPNTDSTRTDPSVGSPVSATNEIQVAAAGAVYEVTIGGVDANGTPLVGTVLTALTKCVGDSDTCDNNSLSYQWQVEERDNKTGAGTGMYVVIPGATSDNYTLTRDMQRLKVKVEVTNTQTP